MITNIRNIVVITLLTSLTVFYSSCEKSNPAADNNEPLELTIDKTNVTPFEAITITATNYTFLNDSYSGTIADRDIELVKSSDHQLTFMMPFIESGSHSLTFNIDDVEHSFDFTISTPAIIDNPSEFILGYKNQVVIAFDSLKIWNQMYNLQIEEQNIAIIENYINQFNQALNTATEDEKQELAQFMKVNPDLFSFSNYNFNEFNDSLSVSRDYVKWDKQLSRDAARFAALMIVTAVTVDAFVLSLSTVNPLFPLITGAAIIIEVKLLIAQKSKILDSAYKPFEFDISGELRSEVVEYNNDESYILGIDANYRTLYNGDQSSSDIIITVVSNINTLSGYWDDLTSRIPGLTTTPVTTLDDKQSYVVNQNSSSVTPSFISIQNISNSNVILSDFSNTDAVKVTFTTSVDEDQDFNFDIVYNNPDFSEERINISAKLKIEIDSSLIYKESALGYYKVNNWEGNGPNSTLYCELLENGTSEYTIYNDPSWPDGKKFFGTWSILKQDKKYYYAEYGFWHTGFPSIEIDYPLSYPVSSFQYHLETVYSKQ
ncbi:MAG: hypothetical protein HQ521_04280 [Bacteroidetes bacterium]|nr:hypothetical protein [Bacteroidota bacterium]